MTGEIGHGRKLARAVKQSVRGGSVQHAAAFERPSGCATVVAALGHRALGSLARAHALQPKLTVSDPTDVYEEEAERVADQVMRMPDAVADVGEPRIQRLCSACEESQISRQPLENAREEEDELPLQGRSIQRQMPEDEELLQTKSADEGDVQVTPGVESAVQSLSGRGEPLPETLRVFMEPRFKADFGDVRVHVDAAAHGLARAVNAQAFTVGSNIVFGAGHYAPDTENGKHLIAHELTHVVQQGGGWMPQVQRHNAADPRLPADKPEALAFAAAADAEIQAALTRLATAATVRERNVPALVGQEGIVLRPLTPRHDSTVGAADLNFFPGSANYFGSVTLPGTATYHVSANAKTVSIRAREHADVDNLLFGFQIDERVRIAVSDAAERLATRSSASAMTMFERYRARFNAIANDNLVMFVVDRFNPSLDSHGPRYMEARDIFNEIYASDPTFRAAYDANAGNIKERVDSYLGPDSLNPIASPGLQRLRAAFFPFAVPVTATSSYNSLRTAIQAVSATLTPEDRAAVEQSNAWQQLLNDHVRTDARRREVRDIIRTPPAPPAAAPAVVPPAAAAPPAVAGAATPQSFVDSISLRGPAAPVAAIGHEVSVTLSPTSTVANPGVAISTQVTATPAIQVSGNNVSPASPWPNGATSGVDFSPRVLVSAGAAIDAQLALVNGPAGLAPTNAIAPAHVAIDDQRQANFATVWTPELAFFDVTGASTSFVPGSSSVRYMAGAQNFRAVASIAAPPGANPSLSLQFEARVDRAGVTVAPAQQVPFPVNATRTAQISLNVAQPVGGVPLGTTDPLTIEMRLLDASNALVPGSARAEAIPVGPDATYTQAQAQTSWAQDEAFFHTSPGLLDTMTANGGAQARFADAVRPPLGQTPLLTFHPLLVRHDSAAFVAQSNIVGGVPTPDPSRSAYFILSPYGAYPDTAHSFIDVAGAAGFHLPSFPGIPGRLLVVNRTGDPSTNAKDPVGLTIMLALHEAVHALDEITGGFSDIERYRREFRAYWTDGRFGPPDQATVLGRPDLDARYDPDMPPPGPKSPRARKIFSEQLYGSVTYPWVQSNYDNNIDHFRELVDSYIVPDGINLALSRRLEALRALINAGVAPNFATFRNRVRAFFGTGSAPPPAVGVLDAGERSYISSSRAWRDLLNARVTSAAHRSTLKTDMGIPL